MKAKDIPMPVWYAGSAIVALLVVSYLVKKGAGAAVDTAKTVGNAINPFNNNNVISNAANSALQSVGIVDSGSSIGSQTYDWLHNPDGTDKSWWAGYKTISGWNSIAAVPGLISDVLGSVGGGTSNPHTSSSSAPYDYGQGGSSGIPYAPGVNPQPDVFNLQNYNWLQ